VLAHDTDEWIRGRAITHASSVGLAILVFDALVDTTLRPRTSPPVAGTTGQTSPPRVLPVGIAHPRRTFSIGRPFASSSTSLSR
jgi:hypothetical protein